jgi:hypothetical protein
MLNLLNYPHFQPFIIIYTYYFDKMRRHGALPDASVHRHFDYIETEGARKPVAVCKCCNKYRKAKNTCRQRVHLLEECTKYHQIVESGAQIQTKLPTLPRIDEARKARIDQKLALAIYTTGRPFSAFQDPAWLDFFQEFNYTPPTRSAIAGPLLDTTYNKLKDEVDSVIDNTSSLGLITDRVWRCILEQAS